MQTPEELVEFNIYNYHYSQDLEYLLNIVNTLSFSEFERILCQLLKSLDREIVSDTCFAIRDLIVSYSHRYDEFAEFGKKYAESLIVKTVESLLFSENRNTVRDAIYTLGKTGSYISIPALNKAFYHLKDTDPFMLPRLFSEMKWLGLENFWELVDSMISSENYFTRWAAIHELPAFIDENDEEKSILSDNKYKYLERLKQDSNKFVRIEAEYRYKMIFQNIEESLPKKEQNKKRKELESEYNSILNFESLSMSFSNYLSYKKLNNYTISQLEEFFDYYVFFLGFYRIL